MNNRKPIIILVSGLLVLIILIAGVLLCMPVRQSRDVRISYIGTTNDYVFGSVVIFAVTNENNRDLYFGDCPPQTKQHGDWSQIDIMFGSGTNLPAHTSSTFTTVVATNGEAWRVPVVWWNAKADFVEFFQGQFRENVYGNWERLNRGQRPIFSSGSLRNGHLVYSPEITNEPSK